MTMLYKTFMTIGMLLCCLYFDAHLLAQEDKPELEFDAYLNVNNGALEVTWPTCLENSVLTLLDQKLRPLKVASICRESGSIDVSNFVNQLAYIRVEHYTGTGIKPVERRAGSATTSAMKHLLENKVTLTLTTYPNPTKGMVVLEGEKSLKNALISVMDIHGRILRTQVCQADQAKVDLSELAKGVYFVRIEQGSKAGVQRIVKD